MSGPFAKFIEGQSIITYYIMSGTPQQNYVIQRRNCTLINIIRSMISNYNLPLFLGMKH
jgi:hypothetical protein